MIVLPEVDVDVDVDIDVAVKLDSVGALSALPSSTVMFIVLICLSSKSPGTYLVKMSETLSAPATFL